MSTIKYPLPCFHTGRILAEGDESQLREYYNAVGMGEPFDQNGHMRIFEPSIERAMREPMLPGAHLTLVKR